MDIAHIAKLANLKITPQEEQKFASQFAETLKMVDLINELDTSGVSPTSQVTGLTNVTRPDRVDSQRILPAPKTDNGYFVVPAIFES